MTQVLYLPFNEGSGAVANDRSGYNNSGAITGALWTTGKYGNCLSFDGNDDYVTLASSITSTARTQIAWIYITQLASVKGTHNFIFNNFYQHTANDFFYFTVGADFFNLGSLSLNTWYHIAIVVPDTTNNATATAYLNGVPYAINQQIDSHVVDDLSKISESGATAFTGKLDEIRIFDSALSSEQVLELYLTPPDSCVLYLPMDEGTGTFVADLAGGNNGTLVNSPGWVAGKYGSALGFSGVNSYVNVPMAGSNLKNLSAFTVAFWITPTTNDGTYRHIVESGPIWQNGTWVIYLETNSDILYFAVQNDSGATAGPSIPFTAGVQIHIVCVYDGSYVKMYKNGALVPASVTALTGTSAGYDYLRVGRSSATLNSVVDDLKIFNRSLTDAEITELYNTAPVAKVRPVQVKTVKVGRP